MPVMYMDWTYLLLLPCIVLSLWASSNVKSTYKRYQSQHSRRGLTAEAAAKEVLRANGVYDVRFERIAGELTDHFDYVVEYPLGQHEAEVTGRRVEGGRDEPFFYSLGVAASASYEVAETLDNNAASEHIGEQNQRQPFFIVVGIGGGADYAVGLMVLLGYFADERSARRKAAPFQGRRGCR